MCISFYSSNMILKILILQISQKHIHPDNSPGSQKVVTCFSETNSKSSPVSTARSCNAHSVPLTLKQGRRCQQLAFRTGMPRQKEQIQTHVLPLWLISVAQFHIKPTNCQPPQKYTFVFSVSV